MLKNHNYKNKLNKFSSFSQNSIFLCENYKSEEKVILKQIKMCYIY